MVWINIFIKHILTLILLIGKITAENSILLVDVPVFKANSENLSSLVIELENMDNWHYVVDVYVGSDK